MRILAVDDDPTFLLLLQSALVSAGYKDVDTAQDANVAMEVIDRSPDPFDCFLLDVRMPGICGIELCRMIRAIPDYRITPILILTAVVDDATIDDAFSAGASDYVTKPIKGLELGARIRSASLLADQTRKSMGLQKSTDQLRARLDTLLKTPLSDALELEAGPSCIAQRDLENFLYLLPKKVYAMTVCALRINEIERLHADMENEAFQAFLSDIATGISREIAPRHHYVAYAGDGVFGCVLLGNARREIGSANALAAGLKLSTTVDGGSTGEVELTYSKGLDCGLQSGRDGADALRLAIAKASQTALMDRLQHDLDRERLGRGAIAPRRPRFGAFLGLAGNAHTDA